MRRGNKTAGICLLLLLFLVPAAIYGCGQKKEVHLFHARILEIREGTMLVEPDQGAEEARSSDAFLVNIKGMAPSPEPKEGDWLEITHRGGIQETYPARLDQVVSIVIADRSFAPEKESGPDEAGEDRDLWENGSERISAAGSLGELSVDVPKGWKAEAYGEGQEDLTYGLYGIALEPEDTDSGRIWLVVTDFFGVCGTGLAAEEISLAGGRAVMGTYDDHKHWDYITFGDGGPAVPAQVIAINGDCSSWEEKHWEEIMSILDTAAFDLSAAEARSGGEENQKEE